jgi:hypothetical protein
LPDFERRILMKLSLDTSRWTGAFGACAVMVLGQSLFCEDALAQPRAVVELFTSQGCSSCPPADQVIGDLAKDPSVIALSMPVDYWDYLGWKDTLADPRFSARQKAYSQMRGDRDVYTPQVVINGGTQMIGSDVAKIKNAIGVAKSGTSLMSVPVSVSTAGKNLNVSVAASTDSSSDNRGEVWICSVSKSVPISVGRGENRGRALTYYNVVRNWLKVGDWNGSAANWTVPLENVARDGVDAAVVYVQDGSREHPGAMRGAAYTALNQTH